MREDLFKNLKSQIVLHGVAEISKNSGVSRSRIYDFVQDQRDLTTKNLSKIMETLNLKLTSSISLESAKSAAEKTQQDKLWKIHFFNFVDDFRNSKDVSLVEREPSLLDPRLKALLASITETLCNELGAETPGWAIKTPSLGSPWFIAGIENLKATALQETPLYFRKRNIFVLDNFLRRA